MRYSALRPAIVLAVLLVVVPGMALAVDGEARHVGVDTSISPGPSSYISSRPSDFALPAEGVKGLVHKAARVAKMRVGAMTWLVAIDGKTADAQGPEVARFDPTGKGVFEAGNVLPLTNVRTGQGYANARLKVGTITLRKGDLKVPFSVSGHYSRRNNARYLWLLVGSGVETKLAVGGKAHVVRIVDGNANLSFADPVKPSMRVQGDEVLVLHVPDRGKPREVSRAGYGSPVYLDGRWQQVSYDARANRISLTPTDLETGLLSVASPKWTARLLSDEYVISLAGGTDAVPVPVGKYVLQRYRIETAEKLRGRPGVLEVRGSTSYSAGQAKLEILPDRTVEAPLAGPLTAGLSVSVQAKNVRINLDARDAYGNRVSSLYVPGGGRAPVPKVAVFDEEGTEVTSFNLEYG